jgi:hypothetical protein
MLWYLEDIMYTTNSGYTELDAKVKANIEQIYAKCKEDWATFQSDPIFLFNSMARDWEKQGSVNVGANRQG